MNLGSKLLDLLFFVVGTVVFLLGVFDVTHPRFSIYHPDYGVAYYYTDTALILIAVGGGLIVLGVVKRMWRK